jgi:hypothetical protein
MCTADSTWMMPWQLTMLLPVFAGGWLLATAHIVTAIIGAGVLGLPYALSWLGAAVSSWNSITARALQLALHSTAVLCATSACAAAAVAAAARGTSDACCQVAEASGIAMHCVWVQRA